MALAAANLWLGDGLADFLTEGRDLHSAPKCGRCGPGHAPAELQELASIRPENPGDRAAPAEITAPALLCSLQQMALLLGPPTEVVAIEVLALFAGGSSHEEVGAVRPLAARHQAGNCQVWLAWAG